MSDSERIDAQTPQRPRQVAREQATLTGVDLQRVRRGEDRRSEGFSLIPVVDWDLFQIPEQEPGPVGQLDLLGGTEALLCDLISSGASLAQLQDLLSGAPVLLVLGNVLRVVAVLQEVLRDAGRSQHDEHGDRDDDRSEEALHGVLFLGRGPGYESGEFAFEKTEPIFGLNLRLCLP